MGLAHKGKRLIRRDRRHGLNPTDEQLAHEHFAVGRVVIDHQHALAFDRDGRGVLRVLSLFEVPIGTVFVGDDGCEMRGEPEGRTLAFDAIHPGFTAHQLHQAAHDREPEARAAEAPCGRGVDLHKGGKQGLHTIGRNADAGVAHFASHPRAWGRALEHFDLERDLALGGKLNRIAGEVQENLADAPGIAFDEFWEPRIDLGGHFQALRMRLNRE